MADTEKKSKFNFEELKAGATSPDAKVRRKAFEEYFERFEEFPSYLFDNTNGVDTMLAETIRDIENDPETPKNMRKGIEVLMMRLPS
jgi:oligoendopeptidase F